eukprot:365020-Chlamydomonas_euryale.AAC.5
MARRIEQQAQRSHIALPQRLLIKDVRSQMHTCRGASPVARSSTVLGNEYCSLRCTQPRA